MAGAYVPTVLPLGFDAATMKPFALTSPSQFRPGPPPALTSDAWARDYNEVKTLGARNSTLRTPEQTATAQFWASNGPQQYLDSASGLPPIAPSGVADRARFFALLSMAISDAGIAVFDAKYAYNFWRPVTAIRNGDLDGNDATERDAGWLPLVDTPLHPEYPCAHCTVGAAYAAVLALHLGDGELAVPLSLKPADARPHDGRAKLETGGRLRPRGRQRAGLGRRSLSQFDGSRNGDGQCGRPLDRHDPAAPAAGNALTDQAFDRNLDAKKAPPKRGLEGTWRTRGPRSQFGVAAQRPRWNGFRCRWWTRRA